MVKNNAAPAAQTTNPKQASTKRNVRALCAGGAPPKPADGSW
jgi:hypothetical protein